MSKDPTPRADMLRQQREARYGHLQATADEIKNQPFVGKVVYTAPATPKPRKLIAYAGRDDKGIAAPEKKKPPRKRVRPKRRTELPPEKETT